MVSLGTLPPPLNGDLVGLRTTYGRTCLPKCRPKFLGQSKSEISTRDVYGTGAKLGQTTHRRKELVNRGWPTRCISLCFGEKMGGTALQKEVVSTIGGVDEKGEINERVCEEHACHRSNTTKIKVEGV